MSVYLDTNFIVALFVPDAFSGQAEQWIAANREPLIVSDFAAAEFSSVIARRVRIGAFSIEAARAVLVDFDSWCTCWARRMELFAEDVTLADAFLRRLDLTLLAPDALHIAIARRSSDSLLTFDRAMAVAALTLGQPVVDAVLPR